MSRQSLLRQSGLNWPIIKKQVVTEVVSSTSQGVNKSFREVLVGENKNIAESENIVQSGVTGLVERSIVNQRQVQVAEDGDKEERLKNIMLYKVKEMEGGDREERKKHDIDMVKSIFMQVGREDVQVKATFRIGRFDPEKQKEGKCRGLKVVLHSKEDQESVMRCSFKLGQCTDPQIKIVNINYDLTESDRKLRKEKIEEAKAKTASDAKFFWKVRGPPWSLRLRREEKRTPIPN